MKLKFKIQSHQTAAVEAVIDCFEGQPATAPSRYRIDPGMQLIPRFDLGDGFKNNDIQIDDTVLLENIRSVQRRQNLRPSETLSHFTKPNNQGIRKPVGRTYYPGAKINLDIEMETGTGKTYCYIKTMFEMNKRFGWSKFIVMVPSIAIREGIYNSFQSTAEHFSESYGKKARFFIYNSRSLHELESFSSDAGINVMIINIQAFNARGKDNRRIYEELDEFQSRRPIDVLCANRPILVLDEPQKMEGKATLEALPKFNPLMILRYSATHRTQHCQIHRLDALDAYNQKLVKKIAVHGIRTRGISGTSAYLFLEGIEISTNAPVARIEMEVKLRSGKIKRQLKRLTRKTDLYEASNGLDQYRDHIICEIDANQDFVEFKDGKRLRVGELIGDVSRNDIRRIQIRETIKAHLDKERALFSQGIKVLSLFFIDEVKKYRDYEQEDEKGEYARVFEHEYRMLREEYLSEPIINDKSYQDYLLNIDSATTHNGYFSIDKKGRLTDPRIKKRGVEKGTSDDATAYDLILKNKEQLLSLEEPTRFIFSHSALREGWDNPNVFVMCMLKRSDSNISRRQEVGRGLRISVDQHGERNDHPALVHEINVLSVIASESYEDFVQGLQTEIADTLTRPRKASKEYFEGKSIRTSKGPIKISSQMAIQIYQYLVRNEFVDDTEQITSIYRQAREEDELPNMGVNERYRSQIIELIDGVFRDLPIPDDGRRSKSNRLNANFKKKEFQELWSRINKKAIYQVDFDSCELIDKCVSALNSNLTIPSLRYTIKTGTQKDELSDTSMHDSDGFTVTNTLTKSGSPVPSQVKYDLIGKIADNSEITRKTAATILSKIKPLVFEQFMNNPERFISEFSRIIKEEKASMVIEGLVYNEIDKCYNINIFTKNQATQDLSRATAKLNNHVYDFAITDSDKERKFVEELDTSSEVTVYAKMPRGFLIPTPIGDYNPDWAISFKVGKHRHLYFVAETKGSMSSIQIRGSEKIKIECAKKFFDETCRRIDQGQVKYGVVTNYEELMDLVESVVN
ncbi:MAG: DEAD/DEAH box helicase family protein [Bacteroidetes bacterium]|nr:DEAD/DEAH box helicase family protein [Bacteroidota bacterium]MDE2672614.1 DEAD/DEAH box helicase family protein [Bacteroidota bacterium]